MRVLCWADMNINTHDITNITVCDVHDRPEIIRHIHVPGVGGLLDDLLPIATAPRDGTYILLFGPSGYIHTPFRCEVCHYDANHRPLAPWITSEDEAWADGGEAPTHWLPLPKKPEGGV